LDFESFSLRPSLRDTLASPWGFLLLAVHFFAKGLFFWPGFEYNREDIVQF